MRQLPARHAALGAAAPYFATERREKAGSGAPIDLPVRRRFPQGFSDKPQSVISCTIVHMEIAQGAEAGKTRRY